MTTLPRGAVIGAQMRALVRKNVLLKRRSPITTAFEVLLPVAFVGLLVFGFTLSDDEVFEERVYNGQHINTVALVESFGGFESLLRIGASGFRRDSEGSLDTGDLVKYRFAFDALASGPLPVPSLGQFVGLHDATRGLTQLTQSRLLSQDLFGSLFGNLLTLGTVHLAPDGPPTRALDAYLRAQVGASGSFRVRRHAGTAAALAYILNATDELHWALLDFAALSPCAVNYTIRVNFTTVPSTFTRVAFVARGLDAGYQQYFLSGVLSLQRAVHGFALHLASPTAAAAIMAGEAPAGPADAGSALASAATVPFPTARYSQNIFYRAVGYLMGFFMANALMYPVSQLARAVVEEKELRVRQTMRCMGLRYEALIGSWLLSAAAQFTLTAVLVTVVMCGTFLARSNPLLVFCLVEAFLLSTISLALLLSTFFSRAKLAAVGVPMVYIALVVPKFAFFTLERNESVGAKLATCLLSPSAFAFGADFLADYEYAEVGVTLANANAEAFSFAACVAMMALDAVLYLLAALYLDHVLPTQYGAPSSPLFCLPRRLRARLGADRAVGAAASPGAPLAAELAAELAADGGGAAAVCEPDPLAARLGRAGGYDGIAVDGLVKAYGSGGARKLAVRGVDLRLARGRISCLLGHNGAGKSTLISVLTGLFPPSAGDCFVFGHSIVRAREAVYARLGVCPQHDVLLAKLTVAEHLALYAVLKGAAGTRDDSAPALDDGAKRDDGGGARGGGGGGGGDGEGGGGDGGGGDGGGGEGEADALLKAPAAGAGGIARAQAEAVWLLDAVGLSDKAHTQAGALSGGMKRKLSVAIALLGGSSAVLLDEPTSGMDPHSRRATWELLQACKHGRALLLTTHYMDEADLLADRTAILAAGRLQADGSSLFLKRHFGLGYTLTVQLDRQPQEAKDAAAPSPPLPPPTAAASRAGVLALLRAHVPTAEPLAWAESEAAFRLPQAASAAFPPMLRALDGALGALGCVGYGLSMTSMDEVFLQLARADPAQRRRADDAAADAAVPDAPAVVPPAGATPALSAATSSDDIVVQLAPAEPPRPRIAADATAADARAPTVGAAAAAAAAAAVATRARSAVPAAAVPAAASRAPSTATSAAAAAAATPRRAGRARAHVQLRAMLRKRWLCARRDVKASFANVLAPVLLVALVQLVLTIDTRATGPRIPLSAALFAGERLAMPVATADGRDGVGVREAGATVLAAALGEWLAPVGGLAAYDARAGVDEARVLGGRAAADAGGAADVNGSRVGWLEVVGVPNATDSRALSRYLLQTYDAPQSRAARRFYALAPQDALRFELEVGAELETIAALGLSALALGCPASRADVLRLAGLDVVRVANASDGAYGGALGGAAAALGAAAAALGAVAGARADVDAFAAALDALAPNGTEANGTALGAELGSAVGELLAPGDAAVADAARALGAALGGGLDDGVGGALAALAAAPGALAAALGGLPDGATLLAAAARLGAAAEAFGLLRVLAGALPGLLAGADAGLNVSGLVSNATRGPPDHGVYGPPVVALEPICAAFAAALPALAARGGLTIDGLELGQLVVGALASVLGPLVAALARAVLSGAAAAAAPGGGGPPADPRDAAVEALLARLPGSVENATAELAAALGLNASAGFNASALEPLVRGALEVGALLAPGADLDLTGRELLALEGPLVLPGQAFALRALTLRAEAVRSQAVGGPPGASELVVRGAELLASLTLATPALPARADLPAGLVQLLTDADWARLRAGGALALAVRADEVVVRADLLGARGVAMRGVCAQAGDGRRACRGQLTAGADGARVGATSGQAPAASRNVSVALGSRLTLLHNSSSPHALGALSGLLQAAQFADAHDRAGRAGTCAAPVVYESGLEPLPRTSRQNLAERLLLAVLASLFVLVPFCYVPAAFATFVVKERVSGATHLQLLSGAAQPLYWLATYVADLLQYALLVVLVLCVLVAYAEPSMVGERAAVGALAAHMAAYGCAVLPQTYALSLGFESASSAQIALIVAQLVGGFVLVMANLIMLSLPATRDAALTLVWVWRAMPAFNFGEGLLALPQAYYGNLLELPGPRRALYDADVLGRPLALNGGLCVAYWLLLLALDRRADLQAALGRAARCWRPAARGAGVSRVEARAVAAERARRGRAGACEDGADAEDADVAAERAAVDADALARRRGGGGGGGGGEGGGEADAVVVRGLYKVYARRGGAPPKLALADLSVRVRPRECFGLLGVNGAGKSTALKILTGFHAPSAGEARVGGCDVASDLRRVYSRIGYCPQTEPLLDWLSAREQLALYAALKNLPPADAAPAAEALIDALGLRPHAHRPCASYSGGNKRKTSLALALLGSPPVVFLDEPSSGMDPLARRHMWDVLAGEARRRAIVLTSHAMEECEALCHRLAIIAAGRLRALGGVQHLKLKFGGGYVLELKCADGRVGDVKRFVARHFGGRAALDEWHGCKLKYVMGAPAAGASALPAFGELAAIFETIEGARKGGADVGIVEYAASQPTLEQVFLRLARGEGEEAEDAAARDAAGATAAPELDARRRDAKPELAGAAGGGGGGDGLLAAGAPRSPSAPLQRAAETAPPTRAPLPPVRAPLRGGMAGETDDAPTGVRARVASPSPAPAANPPQRGATTRVVNVEAPARTPS